jgi:alkylhydroperoxidase family enzyme
MGGRLTLVAYIDLGNDIPGIRGLLAYRPQTAGPLGELAETLLRGDSTLSRGERELIAAYVSRLNECEYCANSHGATAAAQLPGGATLVTQVLADAGTGEAGTGEAGTGEAGEAGSGAGEVGAGAVSDKLRALLDIAALVQVGGRMVTEEAVAKARAAGATDVEIHDTVLIAAMFCMFNRYVDGLGTSLPDDPAQYIASAGHLVKHGYTVPR